MLARMSIKKFFRALSLGDADEKMAWLLGGACGQPYKRVIAAIWCGRARYGWQVKINRRDASTV